MKCRIISHRGLCRKHFWNLRKGENTIEAFREGLEALEKMGVKKSIEFDVRATKDAILVVRHNERLSGIAGAAGFVRDYTAEELQKLDAGYGRKIPLLEEVLDEFKNDDVEFNIELKESGVIKRVKEAVMARGLGKRTIVSAFDDNDNDPRYKFPERFSRWDELSQAGTEVHFALLATGWKIRSLGGEKAFVRKAIEYGASSVNPERAAATKALIDAAHDAGLEVRIWVVNGKREYRKFEQLGVDAVFSDNPFFLQ